MKILILSLLFASSLSQAAMPRLENRTTAPERSKNEIERVARFDLPPGHVTVSKTGRIFMDALAADSASKFQVIELVNGQMVPFPSIDKQRDFKTIHGLFVDSMDRLWILDHSYNGFRRAPHLYGYDINTGAEIESYAFPRDVAGFGSMLNDVVADTVRGKLFISDTSPIARTSAVLIFDIATRTSRRVLSDDPSVRDSGHPIYVEDRLFTVLGVVHPTFGLDGIALDPTRTWLYYAPFTGGQLYRIAVDTILNETLTQKALSLAVEKVSDITMSDGILVDEFQRVYLSDVEHSAIVRESEGGLTTLFKDPEFSWPTGFSLSADGWIYFSCNAIQDTKLRTRKTMLERGPYFLYRFRP